MSELVRLGDHTTKIGSGQTPRGGHRAYSTSGIPLIRSQNVLMGAFSLEGLSYISRVIDDEMEGSRVVEGDVLLNITGASIGRVCVVPAEICPANVNQHVCIIRCKETLMPDYVAAVLASAKYQNFINETQAGGTRQALTKQMVENFEIPLLPLSQQRQLTESIKAQRVELATARAHAQAQAEDIAQLRYRTLAHVFTSLRDAPLKVIGAHAVTMIGSTPARGTKAYWTPAEIPWVKTGEVAFSPITQTEESVSAKALKECSLTLLPPETVLVAMYGQGKTRGQSAVLKVPATTNQACFAILPNETWDPEFLFHWLMASYHDLRALSEGRGGNQANLNGGLLNALEVPAPSREQQVAIARRAKDALHEVDALAAANAAQQDELDRLPQRLLAQAFAH